MAIYHHDEIVDDQTGRRADVAVTAHRFSPGQLLGGAAGVVLMVVGIIAVTRNGVDSSLNTPVTHLMGGLQSSIVGLVELGTGLLLLLSAVDIAYRAVMGAVGALLVIAGVIVAAGTGQILLRVGADHGTGWFVVIMGVIAIVAAAMPSFVGSTRRTEVR